MELKQAEIDFENAKFDGPEYTPALDQARLSGQIEDIYNLMLDGAWRTLGEIEARLKYPQASISAQLRHLRKKRFGENVVLKRRRGNREMGLFEYCLIIPTLT